MARRSTNLSLPELAAEVENLKAMLGKVSARPTFPATQATVKTIRQTGHGFSAGNPVRHNGTAWVKSKADTAANAVVGGIVLVSLNADAFLLWTGGYAGGLTGLTAGAVHYLDATTAGAWTTTAPAIAVPLIHADSTTSGVFLSADVPPAIYRRTKYITKLTSGTSYSVPTTYAEFLFILIAGGGGGGEDTAATSGSQLAEFSGGAAARLYMRAHGGGGGGGETVIIRWANRAAVSSLTYAIGAGGAASANGGNTDLTIDSTLVRANGGTAGGAASVVASTTHVAGDGGLGGSGTGPGYSADSPTNCIVERLAGQNGEDGGIEVYLDATTDVKAYRALASGGRAAYSGTEGMGGDGSSDAGVPQSGNAGCILVFGLE